MSEQPTEGLDAPIDPAELEKIKDKSVSELTPDEVKILEKAEADEAKADAKEEVPAFEPTTDPPFEAPALYPIEFFHNLIKDMRFDFDTRSRALDEASKFNPTSVDELLKNAQLIENYLITGDPSTDLITPTV